MRKKVGRVEAIIIMREAKEFRQRKAEEAKAVPAPVEIAPAVLVAEEPVTEKKSILAYVIDLFKKKGT